MYTRTPSPVWVSGAPLMPGDVLDTHIQGMLGALEDEDLEGVILTGWRSDWPPRYGGATG